MGTDQPTYEVETYRAGPSREAGKAMNSVEDWLQSQQSQQADEILRLIARIEVLEQKVDELTKGKHDNER